MSHDVNRTTEFKCMVEGKLSELIVRNSVTSDQVTKWHYGTTLTDSGVASKSLLRAKVYPDSDDPEAGGKSGEAPTLEAMQGVDHSVAACAAKLWESRRVWEPMTMAGSVLRQSGGGWLAARMTADGTAPGKKPTSPHAENLRTPRLTLERRGK